MTFRSPRKPKRPSASDLYEQTGGRMIRNVSAVPTKSSTLPTVALVGAALLACAALSACGGGSSTTTSQTSSAPATTPSVAASTPSTAPSSATGATASTGSSGAASAGALEAAAVCRSVLARAGTLPANVKAKVEGICKQAESGNLAAAQAAAKGVCSEVIDATVPAGPAREQALAACKSG
jgi:hypothetical protein